MQLHTCFNNACSCTITVPSFVLIIQLQLFLRLYSCTLHSTVSHNLTVQLHVNFKTHQNQKVQGWSGETKMYEYKTKKFKIQLKVVIYVAMYIQTKRCLATYIVSSIIILIKIQIFKKEVGIIIIVRKQVATYLAMKLLATHSKSSMILVTICVCSCKHNSSWVVTSMHSQLKHILQSLAIVIAAKVGIKFSRFARECVSFVHTWM